MSQLAPKLSTIKNMKRMTKKEYFAIGLPKWPALAVVGKPVTRDQAMEILIRTDSLWLSSNDHQFDRLLNQYLFDIEMPSDSYGAKDAAVREKLGLADEPGTWQKVYEYMDRKKAELGHLSLSYLHNARIVSSWIGGPHGWCDWEGNIGSRNYNIGKWPGVKEVYEDWKNIAEAFPFLDLKCQLMGHEAGPDDGAENPVIEFTVKNGKVKMSVPKAAITSTSFGSADMYARFSNPHAERGCTFEMFKAAVDLVRTKITYVNHAESCH